MTTKELIRAEIERRIEWLNTATTDFAEGRRAELRSLYDFLLALPDEPVEKTCKTCEFYENDCPFTRGKFMPYPNRVCKDYTCSTLKAEQEPESEDERIIEKIIDCLNRAVDVNYITLADRGKCLVYLKKQKETPMPNSTELIEMWDKEKAMLKEKDFRDDVWRLAYNAFMDGFARGTYVKFEKQKEQAQITDSVKFEEGFKTGYEVGLRE